MAGARGLPRAIRALQSDGASSRPAPPPSNSPHQPLSVKFPSAGGLKGMAASGGRRREAVSSDVAAAIVSPEKNQKVFTEGLEGINADVYSLAAKLANAFAAGRLHWRTYTEIAVEKGVIGCRSLTLIPVAGSLIGSLLCFLEGCFFVLEAIYQQLQHMDHGRILNPLVEAIDMFLVGTALLTCGMGLYVMFVGFDDLKQQSRLQVAERSNFGLFNLKKLARSMEMNSISQAKSKIGHAVLLIVQASLLDKFKNVPLASGLDLACFAAALFVSSACVFLLSKLTVGSKDNVHVYD